MNYLVKRNCGKKKLLHQKVIEGLETRINCLLVEVEELKKDVKQKDKEI